MRRSLANYVNANDGGLLVFSVRAPSSPFAILPESSMATKTFCLAFPELEVMICSDKALSVVRL